MIFLEGNQLTSRTVSGNICKSPPTVEYKNLASVTAGVWHTIVIQTNWQSDTTGYYKIWFDGVKVLQRFNIKTTLDDSREFEFHVGLYANGWHDQRVCNEVKDLPVMIFEVPTTERGRQYPSITWTGISRKSDGACYSGKKSTAFIDHHPNSLGISARS